MCHFSFAYLVLLMHFWCAYLDLLLLIFCNIMSIGRSDHIRMEGGSSVRWFPLCMLAIFAAIEFVTQYIFIATPFSEVVGIPDYALHFIEVGIPAEHALNMLAEGYH